jgi:lysophospholipase L1-like esterase
MTLRMFTIALGLAVGTAGYALAQTAVHTPAAQEPFRAEIERFLEADKAAPPAPCQVLFAGSSSIVLWRNTLARDMAPLPVINRGFGGAQIADINHWFDQIVAPYRPRAIVFYAGDNDIDAGEVVTNVVSDFATFMERKTRALGQTPVYFISVKPSKLRFREFTEQSQVNDAIRALAARRHDLKYIDVVAPMLERGRPKDLFLQDQLHMAPEGYAIWTREIRAALLPDADERVCDQAPSQVDEEGTYDS